MPASLTYLGRMDLVTALTAIRRRHADGAQYPATVAECLSDSIRYRRGVLQALRDFAAAGPWAGPRRERMEKFRELHGDLCRLYGRRIKLRFRRGTESSYYRPATDCIVMVGRLSVVTYLHEFGHAVFGASERRACRWSINLFRKVWPDRFAACRTSGHLLVAPSRPARNS